MRRKRHAIASHVSLVLLTNDHDPIPDLNPTCYFKTVFLHLKVLMENNLTSNQVLEDAENQIREACEIFQREATRLFRRL